MRQFNFQKRSAAGLRMLVATVFVTVCVMGNATLSQAQIRPDARVGFFTSGSHLTVGGGFQINLGNALAFEPSAEVAFTNVSNSLFFSGDFQLYFGRRDMNLYVGAGLGILTASLNNGTSTSTGLNLLSGIDFAGSGFIPYVQGKVFLANSTNFQLAVGIRF